MRKFTLLFFILTLLVSGCTPFIKTISPTSPISPSLTASVSPASTNLPSAAISPTPDCRVAPGKVIDDQVDSPTLGKTLHFSIYLPGCYSESMSALPAMYLLHGQTYDQSQWQRLGAINAAENLIAFSHSSVPFLIVFPYEQDNLKEPFESQFGDALARDLVPYIDSHYHTCTLRTCRAIAGLSRGAAWSVWIGLHYPALFAEIGGHSFPPFIGDLYRLPTWLRDIPQGQMPFIFLDSGQNDPWLPDTRRFEQVLSDFSVPHTFVINPGGHNEGYWQSHVPEYIQQLADRFQLSK